VRHRYAKGAIVAVVLGCLVLGASYYALQQREGNASMTSPTGGDSAYATALMIKYGCAACHSIPGVHSPGGLAATPLAGIASRPFIAGELENTPANLARWIVDPKSINPRTAMPATGIRPEEARHVASYLHNLR
jgi:cytochrome c1